MQLHKPEQSSITYLTLALTFSMRLKSILKLHQFQQESGVLYLQLLCLRIPFCFAGKGFSEVADWLMSLFHCMVRHGTVRYGSLLGGFPLGTVPGTWYFFSTTSVEVPSEPYRYQNVTCKLCWSLIGRRKSSLLRHWTCDTRPSSTALPARFKSAQPAKDRTQLLFKQTHIFASTTK